MDVSQKNNVIYYGWLRKQSVKQGGRNCINEYNRLFMRRLSIMQASSDAGINVFCAARRQFIILFKKPGDARKLAQHQKIRSISIPTHYILTISCRLPVDA
jgi:hypothetical protein